MRTTEVMEELRKLPPRPAAAARVLAVLDDPGKTDDDLAVALQCDPSLCVRALQMANSPYFGLAGEVGSLERAVAVLGHAVIRSLTVSTPAGLFAERVAHLPRGFWLHSVTAGSAAALVAQNAGLPASEAFCGGLLHDLGAALMFRHDPEGYQEMRATAKSPEVLLGMEAARYGTDHADLGGSALAALSLPPRIVACVARHHDDPCEVEEPLARAVITGEAVARAVFEEGAPFGDEPVGQVGRGLASLGLGGLDGLDRDALVGCVVGMRDALEERAADAA